MTDGAALVGGTGAQLRGGAWRGEKNVNARPMLRHGRGVTRQGRSGRGGVRGLAGGEGHQREPLLPTPAFLPGVGPPTHGLCPLCTPPAVVPAETDHRWPTPAEFLTRHQRSRGGHGAPTQHHGGGRGGAGSGAGGEGVERPCLGRVRLASGRGGAGTVTERWGGSGKAPAAEVRRRRGAMCCPSLSRCTG